MIGLEIGIKENLINRVSEHSDLDKSIVEYLINKIADNIFIVVEGELADELNQSIGDFCNGVANDVPDILDDIYSGTIKTKVTHGNYVEQLTYELLFSWLIAMIEIIIADDSPRFADR